MKKFILACTLITATLCAATAADVPASFPRKFLLEQFTAQSCGNCPYGMLCIAEAMAQIPDNISGAHPTCLLR